MDIQEVQDRYEHKTFGTRFWLLPNAYPEGLNETQLGLRIRVWKPCQAIVIGRTGPRCTRNVWNILRYLVEKTRYASGKYSDDKGK